MLYLLTPSLLWPAPVACKLGDLLPLFWKYSAFLVKLTFFVSLYMYVAHEHLCCWTYFVDWVWLVWKLKSQKVQYLILVDCQSVDWVQWLGFLKVWLTMPFFHLPTPFLLWPAPVPCKLRRSFPLFLNNLYSAFLVKLTFFVSFHARGSWALVLLDISWPTWHLSLFFSTRVVSVYNFRLRLDWLPCKMQIIK